MKYKIRKEKERKKRKEKKRKVIRQKRKSDGNKMTSSSLSTGIREKYSKRAHGTKVVTSKTKLW